MKNRLTKNQLEQLIREQLTEEIRQQLNENFMRSLKDGFASMFGKQTSKEKEAAEEKLRAINSKIINFNDHPNCGTKDCCGKC